MLACSKVPCIKTLTLKSMKSFIECMRRFVRSDEGPTAIEYAVMLAVIVVVCLAAINSVGTKTNTVYSDVAKSLGS